MGFGEWVRDFQAEAERRDNAGDPDWAGGARMHPDVVRSVQRFQVGEAGDGANLIAKAEQAGDTEYSAAVKLFVAEEQNHARMLALLLNAAGASTLTGHWSDTVFVRLRRAVGLRLELMVLLVAEVIALRYYRALRDGTSDPLITDVAGRILKDEERHVPFHSQRLRDTFGRSSRIVMAAWRLLLFGTAVVVAVDHGKALRCLGVTRRAFLRDVLDIARPMDFC
ncbi:ferritin-like domain-containing protein [Kibdelosporangium aridum]|uniref:Ferritin-like domain-containing protein n=1 Tax=Kibdelosporangium aridum TaxID=2030 RepID=A0A428YYP9_KIBAR|nr:ferritin-like domain-containing protein [Kibdelosporangium aridum]RSM75836.1 ferritin-like domain-containing protein [Kibdelosporangium aridum]